MSLRWALLAGCVLAVPLAAAAQPVTGPYVSLGGGVNLQQDEIVRPAPSLGYDSDVIYKFHPGFAGKGSVGFGLGNGLRMEIEGDYLDNVVRGAAGVTSDGLNPPRRGGGTEQKYGGFVNVLYDLNVGLPFQPYVGLGAGGLAVQHDGFNQSVEGVVSAPPPILDGKPFGFHDQTVGGFAYQGIAGFAVPLPWVLPGLSFTAEYHFIGLLDPLPAFQLEQSRYVRVGPYCMPGGGCTYNISIRHIEVEGNRHFANDFNHDVILGFRYALFQPPPAVVSPAQTIQAAPPAPVAARTYLVFFDWDRAELTARARQIVAQAATAAQSGTARIEVDGYTDLSGTAAYNQRLSVRRAQSVRAELVRDGVQAREIATEGRGESNPLVATAAGVREPQNRRVEIILH